MRPPGASMPRGSFEHEPDRKEVLVWLKSKYSRHVEGQHFLVERTADGPVLEELTEKVERVTSFLTDAFWEGLAYGKYQRAAGKARWN